MVHVAFPGGAVTTWEAAGAVAPDDKCANVDGGDVGRAGFRGCGLHVADDAIVRQPTRALEVIVIPEIKYNAARIDVLSSEFVQGFVEVTVLISGNRLEHLRDDHGFVAPQRPEDSSETVRVGAEAQFLLRGVDSLVRRWGIEGEHQFADLGGERSGRR